VGAKQAFFWSRFRFLGFDQVGIFRSVLLLDFDDTLLVAASRSIGGLEARVAGRTREVSGALEQALKH
jgi:hypothetical protein